MSDYERKRTANFTTEEVYQLMELIKKYKHIIECNQLSSLFILQHILKIFIN